MQTGRLFEIIYILIDKKKMTAKELAAHFEVSKRTILRDIETLSMAGIPVYTIQGKGGGISIMDSFVLNKAVLSEDEKNQILFALESLSAVKTVATEQILGKLQSLFGKPDTNWIEVDFSRWGNGDTDKYKFEILKDAILGKRAVSFRYVSSYGEESERSVYPLKLVFKSKAWYLQAFCSKRQDYRTFKINRVLGISTTNESFAAESYTPPPMEIAKESPDAPMTLVLAFAPRVAYRVYDEFDEGCIEKCDNGWLRVSTQIPVDNWLDGFIRSYGEDISIISPQHLKDKFKTSK